MPATTPPTHPPASSPAQEAQPPARDPRRVPLLLDVSYTATRILLLVAGSLTGAISVLSGATWLATALRAGSAVLSVGLLLFLANWLLSRDTLEAARAALLKEMEAAQTAERAAGLSTIEKQA
jgi:hypothetical protein